MYEYVKRKYDMFVSVLRIHQPTRVIRVPDGNLGSGNNFDRSLISLVKTKEIFYYACSLRQLHRAPRIQQVFGHYSTKTYNIRWYGNLYPLQNMFVEMDNFELTARAKRSRSRGVTA